MKKNMLVSNSCLEFKEPSIMDGGEHVTMVMATKYCVIAVLYIYQFQNSNIKILEKKIFK